MADKNYPSGSGITAVEAAGLDANDFVFLGCSIAGAAQKTRYSELAAAFGGSRRNLLLNSRFGINQYNYTSGTATTKDDQYVIDRWRVCTSGESLSWADSEGKRTATAPAGGLEQIVLGTWLQSGTYCISWEGTATCTVAGTARTNGEAFAVTGGANIPIIFTGGTIANPQFEKGAVATPFDGGLPEDDIMPCLRYYWQISTAGMIAEGAGNSTTSARVLLRLPAIMRTTPTLIATAANMSWWVLPLSSKTISAITATYINNQIAFLSITGTGGDYVAAAPGFLRLDSGYIAFDAEIHI